MIWVLVVVCVSAVILAAMISTNIQTARDHQHLKDIAEKLVAQGAGKGYAQIGPVKVQFTNDGEFL